MTGAAQAAPFFSCPHIRQAACGLIPAMRFRVLLPILQTLAMLLIVWAPWNPAAHQIDVILRDTGQEIKAWTLLPMFDATDWAMGVNLPAVPLVAPVEYSLRQPGALPNYKFRFFGFWFLGLLCWYMVGRFVDDLVQWRRMKTLPRKHWADLTFALIAAPSTILLAGSFTVSQGESTFLAACGVLWLFLTASAFIFRVAQIIKQRRKPVAI